MPLLISVYVTVIFLPLTLRRCRLILFIPVYPFTLFVTLFTLLRWRYVDLRCVAFVARCYVRCVCLRLRCACSLPRCTRCRFTLRCRFRTFSRGHAAVHVTLRCCVYLFHAR